MVAGGAQNGSMVKCASCINLVSTHPRLAPRTPRSSRLARSWLTLPRHTRLYQTHEAAAHWRAACSECTAAMAHSDDGEGLVMLTDEQRSAVTVSVEVRVLSVCCEFAVLAVRLLCLL